MGGAIHKDGINTENKEMLELYTGLKMKLKCLMWKKLVKRLTTSTDKKDSPSILFFMPAYVY